jgi:DNA-binding CsgD family transcriptional regulator
LAAEAVTIAVAWFMLGTNTTAWINEQTARLVPISQQAASSSDWSRLDQILSDKNTALRENYSRQLTKLTRPTFGMEGEVYIVVTDHGHSYEIYGSDPSPTDVGETPPWELEAYTTRKTTHTPGPYSDSGGTYLAAFTPIERNGRVIGLVAAETDSTTLAGLRGVVQRAFWWSILPAILVSLVISYVLACMFVDPMDVFRAVGESVQGQRTQRPDIPDLWDSLTPREKEIAELVRQGLSYQKIADKITVTLDTVKTHMKNINKKTGFSKVELAVAAQARREISAPN